MNNKYKVKYWQDGDYAVTEETGQSWDDWDAQSTVVFTGSLADCEAYIRLHESGYM
jgi:hypothetical protein